MGWIQIEAVCGSTKAKHTQAMDIFRGHFQMLPKICVKISIAAGTAHAKVSWKNTVVGSTYRKSGQQVLRVCVKICSDECQTFTSAKPS